MLSGLVLAALARATVFANQATFLINHLVGAAVGAFSGSLSTVGDIPLQGACYTSFPVIDRFGIEFETIDQFHYVFNRHSVSQGARNQFGVIPEFRIKLMRKPFNCSFIATKILKLEIVA